MSKAPDAKSKLIVSLRVFIEFVKLLGEIVPGSYGDFPAAASRSFGEGQVEEMRRLRAEAQRAYDSMCSMRDELADADRLALVVLGAQDAFVFRPAGNWTTDCAVNEFQLDCAERALALLGPAKRPPLSTNAAAVYELLSNLPAHRAMTAPQIIDALRRQGICIDQATLTSNIIPILKEHYGIENTPRIGYRVNPAHRS